MAKFSFSTLLASSLLAVSHLTSAVHGNTCDEEGARTLVEVACSGVVKFETLCKAIEASDLGGVLANPDLSATMWAPNNGAFDRLGNVDALLANKGMVNDLLLLHLSGPGVGRLTSEELKCNKNIKTSFEGQKTRTSCQKAVTPSSYQVGVGSNTRGAGNLPKYVNLDIEACNGIIHEVNNVILPPKKKNKNKAPEGVVGV